jgi:hypothetical protein
MRTTSFTLAALTVVLMLGLIAGPALKAQGPPAANGNYKYIATATTTNVKPTSGYLHTVTINGGTAGVVTLYDIAAAGCTSTPASGKFATIETIGTTNPVTLLYDLATVNGICVVTAAATDLTVSFN